MTIMNERPMGDSAYHNSRIEYMITRQIFTDDNLGVEEPLIDKSPILTRFWL